MGTWKIYFEEPGEEINQEDEIEKRLRKLLTHAFRRPVDKKVINKYVSYAMHGLANGKYFREVMKEVLSAVLASPKFLYLYDGGESKEKSVQTMEEY